MSNTYGYEACYCISIESDRHDTCLIEYNRIKALAKAFNASVHESKSARKGEVLKRDIQISLRAYSHETIIFKEALDIVIDSINIWSPGIKAQYYNTSVERIDAAFGITK